MKRKEIIIFILIFTNLMILFIKYLHNYRDNYYGVYIGANPENLNVDDLAETIVIDAQYYSNKQISELKAKGHIVYTYINLGSIENFRNYYEDYEDITLDSYENWEDEKWVDVTSDKWQRFIDEKSDELLVKGVDGFFVDNCDVYYIYHNEKVFESISTILKRLHKKDTYVLVNGGDEFVTAYFDKFGNLDDILDGVNQESVYTSINWKDNSFGVNDSLDRKYYLDYLKMVIEARKDAYAIEYTDDKEIADIAKECAKENGYHLYISDSLQLD